MRYWQMSLCRFHRPGPDALFCKNKINYRLRRYNRPLKRAIDFFVRSIAVAFSLSLKNIRAHFTIISLKFKPELRNTIFSHNMKKLGRCDNKGMYSAFFHLFLNITFEIDLCENIPGLL